MPMSPSDSDLLPTLSVLHRPIVPFLLPCTIFKTKVIQRPIIAPSKMGAFKQLNSLPVELFLRMMEYQSPRDQLSTLQVFPGLARLLTPRQAMTRDVNNNTILHVLATAKPDTMVDQLIKDIMPRKDINPNVRNFKKQTPLIRGGSWK